ncbi:MAG: pentapeptide repeat-containing protein, partial [Proteobacteria bacterium]|nr:pentapeptide repeat-containing protein [Pseudomonadota bacterium]
MDYLRLLAIETIASVALDKTVDALFGQPIVLAITLFLFFASTAIIASFSYRTGYKKAKKEIDIKTAYDAAVRMLGRKDVKIKGLNELQKIAARGGKEYKIKILQNLVNHINKASKKATPKENCPSDVFKALSVIVHLKTDGEKFWQRIKDINLTKAHLPAITLPGANLSHCVLTGANLKSANLTSANLSNANMAGVNLTNGILINATLTDVTLDDKANLRNVNMTGAELNNAFLQGVNMTATILTNASLVNA